MMQEAMRMYLMIEELARDRQRTLLGEAVAARLAAEVRRSRGVKGGVAVRPAAVRRSAGRRLIAAGAWMAGVAVTVRYREPVGGQGAR